MKGRALFLYNDKAGRGNFSRKAAATVEGPEGTAHNFGGVEPVRIDYIFVNDRVRVDFYDADDESYPNGMYPSDHYAVYVETKLE